MFINSLGRVCITPEEAQEKENKLVEMIDKGITDIAELATHWNCHYVSMLHFLRSRTITRNGQDIRLEIVLKNIRDVKKKEAHDKMMSSVKALIDEGVTSINDLAIKLEVDYNFMYRFLRNNKLLNRGNDAGPVNFLRNRTTLDKTYVLKLIKSGVDSIRELAEEAGVNYETMVDFLDDKGISREKLLGRREQNKRDYRDNVDKIIELLSKGYTKKAVEKELGIGRKGVDVILDSHPELKDSFEKSQTSYNLSLYTNSIAPLLKAGKSTIEISELLNLKVRAVRRAIKEFKESKKPVKTRLLDNKTMSRFNKLLVKGRSLDKIARILDLPASSMLGYIYSNPQLMDSYNIVEDKFGLEKQIAEKLFALLRLGTTVRDIKDRLNISHALYFRLRKRYAEDYEKAFLKSHNFVNKIDTDTRMLRIKANYSALKSRCKKRGIPFAIEIDDVEYPEYCPVLNIKLNYFGKRGEGDMRNYFSYDKFYPRKGYLVGLVFCMSHRANTLKNDLKSSRELGSIISALKGDPKFKTNYITNDDYRMSMYRRAKHRAKKKGMPFTITPEDIKLPARCVVLGIRLCYTNDTMRYNSPSLDRIDNSRGYEPSNIWVISARANGLKLDATVEELKLLFKWMRKVEDVMLIKTFRDLKLNKTKGVPLSSKPRISTTPVVKDHLTKSKVNTPEDIKAEISRQSLLKQRSLF